MSYSNGFPIQTTAGQGLFNGARSTGLIQGQAFPDPATRNALQSGIVSQNETKPFFGGLAVKASISPISASGPNQVLGPVLERATSNSAITGFSVFDQAYNLISDPSNPVGTAGSGQSMNFYALGSRARIAVACSPALVSLLGSQVNAQVSWDYNAQELVPYSGSYSNTVISGAVWASTSGGRITYTVATDLTSYINAGDQIDTSGIVETGGTGGSLNGAFTVVSITSTTIIVAAPATAGYYATYTSGGLVLAGGGALPVTVLDIQPSGCMVVDYNAATGFTTWNYNGAAAIIQLTGGTTA